MARQVALRGNRLSFGEAELVPHEVEEVGRVLAVMDREPGVEAGAGRVHAQQPSADGMERA